LLAAGCGRCDSRPMKLKLALLPVLLATASLAIAAPEARTAKRHLAHPPKAEGASKPKPDTKSPLKEFFHPSETRSTGTVTVGGQPITYDAVAGTLVVHAKDWQDTDAVEADADADKPADKDKNAPKPEASMFYTAYFKQGAPASGRPIRPCRGLHSAA